MSLIVTILEFVLALGVLVFLHELGHYLAAKLFKIQVEEFGFGFPPRMVKLFNIGETAFTLNWIPFGAFVRPKGEDNANEPGGLASASPWVRLAVLFGGPLMNLATGVLLFALFFSQIGIPDPSRVMIADVNENTPAEAAGFLAGDLVLEVEEQPINSPEMLSRLIRAHLGEEITVVVQRDNTEQVLLVTPREEFPDDQGPLGIVMTSPYREASFIESLPFGVRMTYEYARQLVLLPGRLIRGEADPEQSRIMGPKGIYDVFSQARQMDTETPEDTGSSAPLNTLALVATISVALGLTNLLPLPALDGGRILFTLPEIILRRKVPQQFENLVHMIGFIALILLMIFITAQDIMNPVVMP